MLPNTAHSGFGEEKMWSRTPLFPPSGGHAMNTAAATIWSRMESANNQSSVEQKHSYWTVNDANQ